MPLTLEIDSIILNSEYRNEVIKINYKYRNNPFTAIIFILISLIFLFNACTTTTQIQTESYSESSQIIQHETITSELGYSVVGDILTYLGNEYEIIYVDGGDRNGNRESNVAVDIGFGDRMYWGLTNELGQLIYVLADEIMLQNEETEPVNDNGRYYSDEANVVGTEHEDFDQGHVIADSLGGVANAYNITPQNSTLNRHGNQAYMEKIIRDANGCTNFIATITYDNNETQTPSSYKYEYILMGEFIVDEFQNINPEEYNASSDIASIDTNSNGIVTIAEAKAAGYEMPITSDHWLYIYMIDSDGDGMVGE